MFMRKSLLLLVAALSALTASAEGGGRWTRHRQAGEPTVYIISVKETDTIWSNNPALAASQSMMQRNAAAKSAIADHRAAIRPGFKSLSEPSVIFANNRNSFSFAVGGYVDLRVGYGFNSTIDNIDVVPYDIPVKGGYATKQELQMDATTSRVYFRGLANTKSVGKVEIFFDVDFRGGSRGSYMPRLRSGYVSMLGLTVGRDVTTFCDLQASPTTIDFEGPNAYNYNFATVLRYEYSFLQDHLRFGVAAELPKASGTYGETLAPIPQRVPDFPIYFQYAWGANRDSHIRASAVLRNIYLHNSARNTNTDLFGWGVQFSGTIRVVRFLRLFMNGVYGEGITPYIQDLTGSGLDFTPNPADPTKVQTMPMYGWQAAAQINIMPNLFISGGYSTVTVCKKNGVFTEDQYKQGQYVFGNVFYNITPRLRVAAEYLWANRKNMNDLEGSANRVNVMVRYSF